MKNCQKGFSTVELVTVIVVILAVLIGFGGYIKRALAGRWKSAGEAFGQQKQYDPRGFGVAGANGGTLDCFYDQPSRHWIDENCYRSHQCDCTFIKADGHPLPEHQSRCIDCKIGCQNDVQCQ